MLSILITFSFDDALMMLADDDDDDDDDDVKRALRIEAFQVFCNTSITVLTHYMTCFPPVILSMYTF